MTTLVTGGTGFIGGHVVDELLRRGARPRVLVRAATPGAALGERGADVVGGDVRDPQAIDRAVAGVDAICHCAAATGEECSEQEVRETNVAGTRRLLEAAGRAGCRRVVLITGLSVLGLRNLEMGTEEIPPSRSRDRDADMKLEIEQLASEQCERHGFTVAILRPGFVYGPGDTRNLPKLLEAICGGGFAYIGSRANVVPMVHVRDMAQAMLLAAQAPLARVRVYHVTDGVRTTIGDLVGWLCDLYHCPPPRRVVPYPVARAACVVFDWLSALAVKPALTRDALRFLGTSRWVPSERAREELGYVPRLLPRAGIETTVQWMKEQADATTTRVVCPA